MFTELSHHDDVEGHRTHSTKFSTVSLSHIHDVCMYVCTYIPIHNVLDEAACCYFTELFTMMFVGSAHA